MPNFRIAAHDKRRKAVIADSESLLDQIEKEGRDATAEETQRLAGNREELDKLNKKIEWEQSLERDKASVVVAQEPNEPTWPGQPARVGNVREAIANDPTKGFASPRDFLMAVLANADRPARESTDDRLRFLATAGSDEQGGYADGYGGFLLPTAFSPNLMSVAAEADPIGGRTTKIPMSATTVNIPARVDKNHTSSVSGGLTVTRRAETQTQAASRMAIERVTLTASSLFGLAYATEEILADSPISFVAILDAGFRDQFAAQLVDERINGTGVGEYEGILNCPALVSVAKEAGQDADSLVYENLIKMRARCWKYSDAVWLYNHDCLPQLMSLVLPIGTGGVPLWQTSAVDGNPDMILGRPAIATEFCPTVGDKGDVILATWSEYLEGTYEALKSAESIHVRFVNHERAFKFWMRNAGRSWWRSALTPAKSAATLSPFVTLDARA